MCSRPKKDTSSCIVDVSLICIEEADLDLDISCRFRVDQYTFIISNDTGCTDTQSKYIESYGNRPFWTDIPCRGLFIQMTGRSWLEYSL